MRGVSGFECETDRGSLMRLLGVFLGFVSPQLLSVPPLAPSG
jgi:hypothetical protein